MVNNIEVLSSPFNVDFTVENISGKDVRIFDVTLRRGQVLNLMRIPFVSEEDIKKSLLKGELLFKIQGQEIRVLSSNLNLQQFASDFENFLRANGMAQSALPASPQVFVFRPGAPSVSGAVFSDFGALYQVLIATPGPKTILFDDTFGTVSIPNLGFNYNFEGVAFSSTFRANDGVDVFIEDGVVLEGLSEVRNSTNLKNLSNTPSIVLESEQFILIERGSGLENLNTMSPFINAPSGVTDAVIVLNLAGSFDNNSGGAAVLNIESGADAQIVMFDLAEVAENTVDGYGTLTVVKGAPSADFFDIQGVSTVMEFAASFVSNIIYFPADLADWDGNFPDNVSVALDRIAAAIGPIP